MRKIYALILSCFICSASWSQNPNWGWGLPVTVSINGSTITCSVYDPIQSQTKTASYSDATNYVNSQGVVAWKSGSYADAVIYDINLHAFKHSSWGNTTSTFSNFSNQDGVVAWTNGSYGDAAVYDPISQAWKHSSWGNTTSTFSHFSNARGVVAWSNGSYADAASYNPESQQWSHGSWGNTTSTFSNFINAEGVVAWSNGSYADAAIYNVFNSQWVHSSWGNTTSTFSFFKNQNGVVAWTNGSYADAAAFDPMSYQWDHSSWGNSNTTFSNFDLSNGTLTYTNSSSNYIKGYNVNSSQWQNGVNTSLYCKFYNKNASGTAPLITYFYCLSIGGDAYSYSAGDGHTITRRWAWKEYMTAGSFNAQLTVFNNINNSTCDASITVSGVGVENYSATNSDISVSPNPASSKLLITTRFPEARGRVEEADIYNSIGQLVKNSQLQSGKLERGEVTELNIAELSPGIYFLRLTGEKIQAVVRFIKE